MDARSVGARQENRWFDPSLQSLHNQGHIRSGVDRYIGHCPRRGSAQAPQLDTRRYRAVVGELLPDFAGVAINPMDEMRTVANQMVFSPP